MMPSESAPLALPGLRCPICGRVSYDEGGGRACYDDKHERCGVMESITLYVSTVNPRSEEAVERAARALADDRVNGPKYLGLAYDHPAVRDQDREYYRAKVRFVLAAALGETDA